RCSRSRPRPRSTATPGGGLAVSGGMTMVHDAMTGTLRMLIADGGLLTELRTAAAGAVAPGLLAPPGARPAAGVRPGRGGPAPPLAPPQRGPPPPAAARRPPP